MTDKKKLKKLFYDAYKRNDRSLAAQAWELNQALGKDGLTLEEIHDLHFEIWFDWAHSWEEKYRKVIAKELLLDPDGDSWLGMVIAGNWYPYLKSRDRDMRILIGGLEGELISLMQDMAEEERKRFFYDIIPTPYM